MRANISPFGQSASASAVTAGDFSVIKKRKSEGQKVCIGELVFFIFAILYTKKANGVNLYLVGACARPKHWES